MSYNTLFAKLKNTNQKLYEKMISNDIFTDKQWDEVQTSS